MSEPPAMLPSVDTGKGDPGGVAGAGRIDPVQLLRRRNQRAVQFLSSIKASQAEVGPAQWGDRIPNPREGGVAQQTVAGYYHGREPSVPTAGSALAQQPLPHTANSVGDVRQADPNTHLGAADARTALRMGGANAAGDDPAEPQYQRQPSYAGPGRLDPQYLDVSNPPKATPFPTVFSSIKPFIGKNEDRANRHGTGMTNTSDPIASAGTMRKDQSFAYLLYPLNTLKPGAEQEAGEAGDMYEADALDDTGLQKGIHRAVAGLTEYMGTIFDNVRTDDQRQEGGADRPREAHSEVVTGGPTLEQAIQRRFEVSANLVLDHEFSVFAELDFSLWVPRREFMPHFLRMFESTDYDTLTDYLGSNEFFSDANRRPEQPLPASLPEGEGGG
ncbi:hypothetical protein GGF46_003107 [Coemansia sp. RSA 552]|nr:hypothetical protein GGF46_003107 [Coemansia sp. RSA 552]